MDLVSYSNYYTGRFENQINIKMKIFDLYFNRFINDCSRNLFLQQVQFEQEI